MKFAAMLVNPAKVCAMLAAAILAHSASAAPGKALLQEIPGASGVQLPAQAVAARSRVVKVNLGQIRSGQLHIELPGADNLSAVRDFQYELGDGRHAWIGRGNGNRQSQVVIGVSGNAVAGTFVTNDRMYKLEPRADGSHVISEVAPSDPAPEMDPIPVADAADSGADNLVQSAADVGTSIDVMVAYTPAVRAIYGADGAEALIVQAVAEANQAYINSGITARLNLVHTTLTSYTESGNMGTDLSRLRSANDGHMDELHALRDRYGADLVSVLQHEPQYCGLAYRMANLSTSFASSAFSVVHHSCATGYYSFAHELGHNQGAHHNRENATGAIYPYAYGYRDDASRFRTVMAYDCGSGCIRVNNFSSPTTYYASSPTGISGYADNRRTLNETAATVANFRSSGNPLPGAPENVQLVATSATTTNLTWNDRGGSASSYQVDRKLAGQRFVPVASLPGSARSFADSGLQPSSLYYYRIWASNSAGDSERVPRGVITPQQEVVLAVPSAPEAVKAISGGPSSVEIDWTDTSEVEQGFVLQQRVSDSWFWEDLATLPANTTTFTANELFAATGYHYRVRAYNDSGMSAFSPSGTATTGTTGVPPAPLGLSAQTVSATSIILGWLDDSSLEQGFVLQRRLSDSWIWEDVADLPANTLIFTDSGLKAATSYHYRVRAYSASGSSNFSQGTSAETDEASYSMNPELNADAYKVKSLQKALLNWSQFAQTTLDIYRDGVKIGRVDAGIDTYTDHIDRKGGGSYTYQVCDSGTGICTGQATVTF